jgi:hypothetical protein
LVVGGRKAGGLLAGINTLPPTAFLQPTTNPPTVNKFTLLNYNILAFQPTIL